MISETKRKMRVLVVEDEPLVAIVVEDALEEMGHEIVGPMAKLSEAIVAATTVEVDCAILDINIRGGFSYAVAEILLQRGCPVLFATGYREWSLPTNLRGERLMTKPYSQALLDQEIRMLCDRVT